MEEQGRVEHLHIDAQLVHVAYPGFHVQKLAGRLNGSGSLVIAPAPESDRAVDKPEAVRPGIARRGRSSRIERDRLEAACPVLEVFPGGFRFVYMRINVYAKHGSSFSRSSRITAVLISAIDNSQGTVTFQTSFIRTSILFR